MIKTVMATVFVTVTVLAFVFSVFLNGILGLFGLVSTSLETLSQLKDSQEIVQTMKKRNTDKKNKAPKKFARKAGTRVVTSAAAAATIGTAAVTIIVFGLEVHDYCEEKEQLLEEQNLLYGTHEAFNYEKCLAEAKNDSEQIYIDAKTSVSESVKESWETTANFTQEQWDEFERDSGDAWDDLKHSTFDLFDYWSSYFD